MADAPAATKGKSGSFGFLTRKLGPVPVWGWGLGAVGVWYWYTHFGPGKKSGTTVTDPAGNTCSALAPSGYCPGTPEDLAAQQTQTMPAGSSDGSLPVPPMPPAPGPVPPGPVGPPVKPPPGKRPPPSPPPRLIGPPARVPPRPPPRRPPTRIPPGPTGPPVIAPPRPVREQPLPEPRPVPVAAPMTGGDIYGGVPVSRIDGTTYDSGYPSAAQMGGAYVPAG